MCLFEDEYEKKIKEMTQGRLKQLEELFAKAQKEKECLSQARPNTVRDFGFGHS